MKRWISLTIASVLSIALVVIAIFAYRGGLPVLLPSGTIGMHERDLMAHTVLLMLIVVVPVYLLVILVIVRYRATNTKAAYTPEWEHSRLEEFVWWTIPLEIVLVLGAVTWNATHALDPEAAIQSDAAPYTVQVVALPWKWLFIYPDTNIASVNELVIPAGRPVDFQITADAPMNSFWVPALGGQMYAMSGMMTHLHLLAPTPGTYEGGSANYSGEGFGQMSFPVRVLSEQDFEAWEETTGKSPEALSSESYAVLATPGTSTPVRYYGSISFGFMDIVHTSIGLNPDD
jgi:cytochrome o ubiquinol oxidase subunit 2